MSNNESASDVVTRAKIILHSYGYVVFETCEKNPLIHLIATNSNHILMIRIKTNKAKKKTINQIMEDNRADLITLHHIPKPENAIIMFWVWFDNGDEWQRFLVNRGGDVLEIYESI